MCLAAAILPWVVDLLNSLGYTITIRTSSSEEEQARARGASALSAAAAAAPSIAASVSLSSASSSAAAAEGGGRGPSRTGMTAASLQMTTIGPEKENDSRNSNNQKSGESNANMVALQSTGGVGGGPTVDTITPAAGASPTDSNNGTTPSVSRTCCFCWCCCCSCSCITVQKSPTFPPTRKKQEEPDVPHKVDDLPAQDELKAWGESFDKLMQSIKGREKFREFLRSEYSEENVLFWLACEELKKQTNPETIEERARSIYEDYISILSPKEVSLDSRAREVINRNMVHPSPHTFDDAQLQIYTLMHRDSYPRFLNSNIYKRLLTLQ